MHRLWKFFTSLKLTVACLGVGILIVFFGTIAQVHEGLYGAQSRWFKAFIVWVNPATGAYDPVHAWLPLPGGYTIGFLLLANLIAAHIKRFDWSPKKIGIQLTHLGVIMLLVGQLVTDLCQVESHLGLREGQAKSYTEDHRENELVVLTDGGEGQDKVVSVPEDLLQAGAELPIAGLPLSVRVKEYHVNGDIFYRSQLAEGMSTLTRALTTVEGQFSTPEALVPLAERAKESSGRVAIWEQAFAAIGETNVEDIVVAAKRIQPQKEKADKLCAELRTRFRTQMLEAFSMPRPKADPTQVFLARQLQKGVKLDLENMKAPAEQGVGPKLLAFDLPENKDGNTRNLPWAVLEVLEAGKSLGTYVVWPMLNAQEIKLANGQTARLALRFMRYYHPFSVRLVKATHEIYPGTATAMNPEGIPKNFQSRVQINNPVTGDNREVDIYMNNPLRYGGLTFFQYQMGRDEMAGREVGTSTLQVVRNPGWLTPYFGCGLVALGMVYQFLFHLIRFIDRRGRPTPPPVPKKKSAKQPPAVPVG
jgi:hypothetical protein